MMKNQLQLEVMVKENRQKHAEVGNEESEYLNTHENFLVGKKIIGFVALFQVNPVFSPFYGCWASKTTWGQLETWINLM